MSLGWLTESSILPRKRKEIEGVTQNTLVELKAALYDQQQSAKKPRITPRLERGPLAGKNKGVEERIQKDLDQLRKLEKDPYASLQKKAQLYNKLLKGEMDDINEEHLVDFEQKQMMPSEENTTSEPFLIGNELVSKDMQREAERREWEESLKIESEEEKKRLENTKVVEIVAQKTATARERVKKMREQKKKKLKKRIAKIKKRAGQTVST